jgi:hypothetical protein
MGEPYSPGGIPHWNETLLCLSVHVNINQGGQLPNVLRYSIFAAIQIVPSCHLNYSRDIFILILIWKKFFFKRSLFFILDVKFLKNKKTLVTFCYQSTAFSRMKTFNIYKNRLFIKNLLFWQSPLLGNADTRPFSCVSPLNFSYEKKFCQ